MGDVVSIRGRIGFRGYKETDLVSKGQGAITFSPSDIDEMGNVSNENNKYLSWKKYEESPEIQVQVGDILFTKTASIGKIGYVHELKEKATINPQFALLTPYETTKGYFTFLAVRNDDFMKQVRGITGGSSVPTMSQEKLKELTFLSPSIKEQECIGAFFKDIDYLIALHQRKCDELKIYKKGLLQQMFPQPGESIPHVRFPGFTDPWEQRKLSDEFVRVNERNDGSFGKNHWISVAKMYFQEPEKVQSNNLDTRTYVMRLGDIAFEGHPNSDFQFGRFVANDIGDGIISELFPIYRHKLPYENSYWKYAIQIERVMRPIYAKAITSSGASSNKLNEEHFLRESILVPRLEEQKAIGSFFTGIDNLITLHQRKCDELKTYKKGLLQKMFV